MDFVGLYSESYVQIISTITLGRPTARLSQNTIWVGQTRIWVGHGLPGLIARTATAYQQFTEHHERYHHPDTTGHRTPQALLPHKYNCSRSAKSRVTIQIKLVTEYHEPCYHKDTFGHSTTSPVTIQMRLVTKYHEPCHHTATTVHRAP